MVQHAPSLKIWHSLIRILLVSGTLIQIPHHGTILLDCGENTWGQLARTFGDDPDRRAGVWQVLRDLKCIFLSHMHGDHHMGLSKILMMRAAVGSHLCCRFPLRH